MSDYAPEVRIFTFSHGDPLFAGAAEVRRRVFMEEQGYGPEEEWDDYDSCSTHYLALVEGEPAGTLRWWDDGGWFRIGRLAVLPTHRGRGLARRLLSACLEEGRARGYRRSCLNAQADKAGFYRPFGYRPVGGEFDEGTIPHLRMELRF